MDYDAHKRADLVPTLRAYVRSNLNMSKTASVLGVNPNTVVHRLRRIRELTHRDPNDSDDLLMLAIGLRLLDSVPPDTRLGRPHP
ncbi:helix-turn-helix domain-containing protein [Saccharopolyspora sp. NPDC049426]|uniref:PucR family transcriptional regulator n=1 Tax=Saccharopolyspora sp. NPDC049426 TaxID=3155652 RepID=UPI003445C5C4